MNRYFIGRVLYWEAWACNRALLNSWLLVLSAGGVAAGEQTLTKRQRRRLKAEEEERVRAAELRQLRQPPPESEVDFEALVSQF